MSRDVYGHETAPHPRGTPPPEDDAVAPSQRRPDGSRRASYVVGPNGDVITMADLPLPRTKRWVIRRKAEVVFAVRGGLLSLDDACRRYRLTTEEFRAWQTAIERHGLLGLRSTHLKDYR